MDGKNTTPVGRYSSSTPATREQSTASLPDTSPAGQWSTPGAEPEPEVTLSEIEELMRAANGSLEEARTKARLMDMRMARMREELEEMRNSITKSLLQQLEEEQRNELVERMRAVAQLQEEMVRQSATIDMYREQLDEQAKVGGELMAAEERVRTTCKQVGRLLNKPVRDSGQARQQKRQEVGKESA